MAKRKPSTFEYDVCLSFAGEDRNYVRRVADVLKSRGIRIFYDEYAQVNMWGKDLYIHLDEIYQNTARFCVLFASKHYAKKVWTNHERQSAQARAIRQHSEYILPAKFDNTQIPGLRPTIGYIDLSNMTPEKFAEFIIEKVGKRQTQDYFPPQPDLLFKRLKTKNNKSKDVAFSRAYNFFSMLKRMSKDEREVIFQSFISGCPSELPDNTHINVDLLRRITGFAPSKIRRLLSGVSSLGFVCRYRAHHEHETEDSLGKERVAVIEWHDMSIDNNVFGNATSVINEMILGAIEGCCRECGIDRLRKLDFSQLATVTTSIEEHHMVSMAQEKIRCGKCGTDNWVDPFRTISCKKCGAPIKGTKAK